MATIGERIKTLRTASNLNQEEFGKQFGLVKSTVSLYENGKSTPDDETKKKICEKYNVSMDWLYGLTVDSLLGTERSEKQYCVSMDLKQLRERAGLSQAQLGQKLGLSQRNISYYENGERVPPADILVKLSDIFDVTVDSLLGIERSEENFGHTIATTKFGEILRSLRLERNLTQKELANRLSISPSTVGMYEQNRRFPDADILVNLSSIFDVSVDYLLGLEDARSKKLQMGESEKEDLQKIITDLCQITQNLKAWIERNL